LATLIRTITIVGFLLLAVMFGREFAAVKTLTARTWILLLGSGLCTGLSWACYFRALQLGPVSKVAPIDKLSVALTVLLAIVFLGEPFQWKTFAGATLIVAGSLVMLL
jgi:transporter family protein